jgi:glycosyltransferase involved in cell wall biosynthesis
LRVPGVLLLVPVLPSDVLATARILEDANLLGSVVTRSVAVRSLSRLFHTAAITGWFSRRPASPVAKERTEAKWTADLVFYLTLALTRSRTRATDASFSFLDHTTAARVDSKIAGVFAREDCCLCTFRHARDIRVPTIYQLPTAYWRLVRELMEREREQFPDICNMATGKEDFADERIQRKDRELDCADHVLCPSTFVRESLVAYRPGTYTTIPFAIDNGGAPPKGRPSKPTFLYAGNITMRKGVHRLLLAWKELKAYRTHELRLVGDMFLSAKFLKDFEGMYVHVPRVTQEELNQHYREAAAFVFNPVADGFGHVVLEAMATGTPVLASKNSGAPDVITDHVNGLLFNYGDEEQFATTLNWALSRPAELADLGKTAAATVRKRTWKDYGDELLGWMRPLLKHE